MYEISVNKSNMEYADIRELKIERHETLIPIETFDRYFVIVPEKTSNYLNYGLSMLRNFTKFKFIDRELIVGDKVRIKPKFKKNIKRALSQGFYNYVNLKYNDSTIKLPLNLILLDGVVMEVVKVAGDLISVKAYNEIIEVHKEFLIVDMEEVS